MSAMVVNVVMGSALSCSDAINSCDCFRETVHTSGVCCRCIGCLQKLFLQQTLPPAESLPHRLCCIAVHSGTLMLLLLSCTASTSTEQNVVCGSHRLRLILPTDIFSSPHNCNSLHHIHLRIFFNLLYCILPCDNNCA